MSDFGDFTDDDAFDTVTRRPGTGRPQNPRPPASRRGFEAVDWDGLGPGDKARLIKVAADLIAWGRRQGIFR